MMAAASHVQASSYVIWVTPCGPRAIVVHHGGVTDQAIAACGGNAREAVRAQVAANDAGCFARGAVAAQQNARDEPGHQDVEVAVNQYRATTGPPKR
jgi:hypothetical protein